MPRRLAQIEPYHHQSKITKLVPATAKIERSRESENMTKTE